jgi:hypothetical protein
MRRTYRLPHLRKNNYPATLSPIGPPSWGHAERRRFLSSSRKESWGNAERNVSRCVSGLASPMELPGFRSIFRKPSRGTEGERAEKTHLLRTGPPLHFPHPRKSAPTPYKPRRTILKQPLPPASFSPLRKNNTPEIKTRRRLTAGRASKIAVLPITGWQTSQSWHPCRCGRAGSEVWRGGLYRGSRLQSWQCGEYAGGIRVPRLRRRKFCGR